MTITEEQVIEGNKLIAEFMEFQYDRWLFDKQTLAIEDCGYHTSWDWLMPVVEKIEQHGCIVEIWLSIGGGCRIQKPETKIKSWQTVYESNNTLEAVWLAVVEFIKYWNNEKSNQMV